MGWKDRFVLKMMSNRIIMKIFSIPIILKITMWEMKILAAIISIFKKKQPAA